MGILSYFFLAHFILSIYLSLLLHLLHYLISFIHFYTEGAYEIITVPSHHLLYGEVTAKSIPEFLNYTLQVKNTLSKIAGTKVFWITDLFRIFPGM